MYITMETDYAVRIMMLLAEQKNRIGAQQISEQTRVSLRFALKILRKLTSAEMVISYRGVGGGYEILKSPEDISLYDIVTLIQGDVLLSRCLHDTIVCNRDAKGTCLLHRKFSKISEKLGDELCAVALSDLIAKE